MYKFYKAVKALVKTEVIHLDAIPLFCFVLLRHGLLLPRLHEVKPSTPDTFATISQLLGLQTATSWFDRMKTLNIFNLTSLNRTS